VAAPEAGQAPLITLDTSALYALLNKRDPDHARVVAAFRNDAGPHLVPAAAMAELGHLVEARLGAAALDALLADLEERALHLDCEELDLPRVRELIGRYGEIDVVDATVIACAERNGGRVLTLDPDFRVVAREGTLSILPE
jgi:uncharacterized protein